MKNGEVGIKTAFALIQGGVSKVNLKKDTPNGTLGYSDRRRTQHHHVYRRDRRFLTAPTSRDSRSCEK
jgi:hypothetical protein